MSWWAAQRRYLNLYLWVLQGWLAMFFMTAAFAKLTVPMDQLNILMSWPERAGRDVVRAVGYAEAILAIGLLVPLVIDRWSWSIVRIATTLLMANVLLMIIIYMVLGDTGMVATNVILLIVGLCILKGRDLDRRHHCGV